MKAYSAASTATVMLETWSEGYDWDENGVRTKEKISWNNRENGPHKGGDLTYDTVREVTTGFTASYGLEHQSLWSEMITGGALVNGSGSLRRDTIKINSANGQGTINHPGLNWFKIQSTVGGQVGYRPLRLIAFMAADAGADKTVRISQQYDHRDDVTLHMIDTLTDNLVVGTPDDNKPWATSIKQGYPNSRKYYNVPTAPTRFSASQNAVLHTEIWRAKQNPDGSYVQDTANKYGYTDSQGNKLVPEQSVRVTGPGTGAGNTLAEKKWNGEIPLSPNITTQRKYIVSYYWMLEDGRYCTDNKIITVEPGEYSLSVAARTMGTGTVADPLDSEGIVSVYASPDDLNYQPSIEPQNTSIIENVNFGRNVSAQWKILDPDAVVRKLQLEVRSQLSGGNLVGAATIDGPVEVGDEITVSGTVYYDRDVYDPVQEGYREETLSKDVTVTYIVMQHPTQPNVMLLRFNKLKNVPSWELHDFTGETNDSTGIVGDGEEAYINDISFDMAVNLWVSSGTDFEFIKVDKDGNAFGAGEAEFELYSCVHAHDAYCGGLNDPSQCNHVHEELATNDSAANGCWAVEGSTVLTEQTDAAGKVLFEALATGEYMLAETRTKDGYQLPMGQWLVQVDAVAGTTGITAKGEMPPAFKTETVNGETILKLPNYPVWTTPSSGGMGTILFTVGGIVLIGAAVILLVVTRKKKDKKGQ